MAEETNRKITACDIEIAIARKFNWRQNLIVPNVHWGLGLGWEADMLILRPSGYLTEIEIKTTASDLMADRKKDKWGRFNLNQKIKFHFFAVPHTLADRVWRPESGIISIEFWRGEFVAKIVRPAKMVKGVIPLAAEKRIKLAELGAMRVWDLKAALLRKQREKGGG